MLDMLAVRGVFGTVPFGVAGSDTSGIGAGSVEEDGSG